MRASETSFNYINIHYILNDILFIPRNSVQLCKMNHSSSGLAVSTAEDQTHEVLNKFHSFPQLRSSPNHVKVQCTEYNMNMLLPLLFNGSVYRPKEDAQTCITLLFAVFRIWFSAVFIVFLRRLLSILFYELSHPLWSWHRERYWLSESNLKG